MKTVNRNNTTKTQKPIRDQYDVTKKFVGGVLDGITIVDRTTVSFPVSEKLYSSIRHSSPFVVLACVKVEG